MISHPVDSATYKIIEVYDVKNKSFFTDLGIFDTHKDQISLYHTSYLYLRRMNLNRTKLEMNIAERVNYC